MAVVSSRVIAERFNKRHDDLLRSIQTLKAGLLKNEETPAKYFIQSDRVDGQNGERYPEYLCTRDGVSLLVMGFAGKETLDWEKILA